MVRKGWEDDEQNEHRDLKRKEEMRIEGQ